MTAEQFRPQFTTSQEAAEKKAEGKDPYFGSKVRTVEGTTAPTGRSRPLTRAMKPVEPQTFTPALSNRQKRMLKKK